MGQELTERVSREKDWHNQKIAEKNIRQTQEEYACVLDRMVNDYTECINIKLLKDSTELLDYGCGAGYGLIDVSNKIKNGVGIDISDVLIDNAKLKIKEKNIKNIEFFVMDAMNTTFESETFSLIRGSAILHHLDLKASLNEIKRILKPEGNAIFFEPLGINPAIALYRKLTPKIRTIDEHPFTGKDIKQIKETFPNTKIRYYSFFTLLAIPFRKIKFFPKILSIANFMDKIVLSKYSPLKYMAWVCLIEMRK
jgi:ubiquinone/menaquinone biosynthesis C-methylase UbiE